MSRKEELQQELDILILVELEMNDKIEEAQRRIKFAKKRRKLVVEELEAIPNDHQDSKETLAEG